MLNRDHGPDLMAIENIEGQDLDQIEIIILETIEITKINMEKELMAVIEMIIEKKIIAATEMKEAMKEDNVIIKNKINS